MKWRNGTTLALATLLLLAAVLGCGGSKCRSEITVEGKTFAGTDPNKEQSTKNACSKYCIDGDPDFDIAYQKWLQTPEAQKVPDRHSKWAAYATNKDLNAMAERCSKRCAEFIEDGVYKLKVDCN